MEIGSLNPASYAPLKAAESRAVAERPRAEDALQARQARRDAREAASREGARNARETEQVRERPAAQPVEVASGGNIQFEDDQGTRVMKVLDSKDVLIYQVPPKGELTLIRAAEAEAQRALALA